MNSCIGISLAYALAAFCPTTEAANALLPTYVTVNIFLTGYLIVWSDIPLAWRWYPYINPMLYAWVGNMKAEFQDSTDRHADASSILKFYDLDRFPGTWPCLFVLIIFCVFYILLALVGLRKHVAR